MGYEIDLYTVADANGALTDAIEVWLGEEIETPAASAIAKLIDGGIAAVNGEPERSVISAYIGAQDLRTPTGIEWIRGAAHRAVSALRAEGDPDFVEMFRDAARNAGVEDSDEDVAAECLPSVSKDFWATYLGHTVDTVAERVHDTPRQLVRAPEGFEFVTSDVGITKHFPDLSIPVRARPGWPHPDPQWAVPLAWDVALCIGRRLEQVSGIGNLKWCEAINTRTADNATRYVFASTRRDDVLAHWGTPEPKRY